MSTWRRSVRLWTAGFSGGAERLRAAQADDRAGLEAGSGEAFIEEVVASPLARSPYDLRHAAVSTWLNGGVPATDVAAWAGHSVEVLLKIYAKCLDGGAEALRQRAQAALGHGPAPSNVRRVFGMDSTMTASFRRAQPDVLDRTGCAKRLVRALFSLVRIGAPAGFEPALPPPEGE
jgi:hypothetical protein